MPSLDFSLCVILDRGIESRYSIEDFTRMVISGGATSLQVRLKNESTRGVMDFAERVLEVARPYRVPVVINDRVDVAMAVEADGVHLGAEDMPIAAARRLAGPSMALGATVRDLESARQAASDGADYLGVGAVFATPVKPDLEPISLDILDAISHEISLPIVAIGGINEENAAVPLEHGASGVAVISALRKCLDPKEAAARLRAAVDKAKKR